MRATSPRKEPIREIDAYRVFAENDRPADDPTYCVIGAHGITYDSGLSLGGAIYKADQFACADRVATLRAYIQAQLDGLPVHEYSTVHLLARVADALALNGKPPIPTEGER